MANPLPNEDEIYAKIRKIVEKGDPDTKELLGYIWDLAEHHVGNEAYKMQLNVASYVMCDDPEDIPAADGAKILTNCDLIRGFFDKLKAATKLKD